MAAYAGCLQRQSMVPYGFPDMALVACVFLTHRLCHADFGMKVARSAVFEPGKRVRANRRNSRLMRYKLEFHSNSGGNR